MQKILIAVTLSLLLCFATACSSADQTDTSQEPPAEPSSQTPETPEASVDEPDTTPEENKPAGDQNPFEGFAAGLDKLGLEYEEVVMGAELVGAVQGMKYILSDGQIELYMFEEGSEALEAALDSGTLTLEGVGAFPAQVRGKYAMLLDDVSHKEEIQALFDGLE